MLNWVYERLLQAALVLVVQPFQRFDAAEAEAGREFVEKITSLVVPRRTSEPIVIGMIGLVGSGKSSVAKQIAEHIGATVVNADEIRIALRRQGARYENARVIAESAAQAIVWRGGNVVIDSDFSDPKKRASLREAGRRKGLRVEFFHTYANLDVVIGRMITATYRNEEEDFFGSASTPWEGSAQSRGAVAKLREMIRRLPHHYRWINSGGGQWQIKIPPCKLIGSIDTTDELKWPEEVWRITINNIVGG